MKSIDHIKLSGSGKDPLLRRGVWGEIIACTMVLLLSSLANAQQKEKSIDVMEKAFLHPPSTAKPWVFWYWMHGAISKKGITADLEAMKEVGIGGAYLMTIKDTSSAIPFQPTARQITPEWWAMIKFAMQEAKRLGLQLGLHVSDGFALAGGPWITPDISMQKLVWTKTYIKNNFKETISLEQPETNQGYYKDIAVFAYPANSSYAFSDEVMIPSVTTSNGAKAQFLSFPDPGNKENFRSDSACWIQYKYPKAYMCRSIHIRTGTNSYQAQRLIIKASDDGINFRTVTRLEPPRHGWQDTEEDYTHAIPPTTAKYFRFVYDKDGSEPGAEDLDAAKWRPSLRVMGIYLSDEPVIHQFEAKNGSVWRIAANTTAEQLYDKQATPLKGIINLTGRLGRGGILNWTPPGGIQVGSLPGWVIVRIGHTTTGQTNATGGAGKGLECDKFNPVAIKLQFDNWFAKAFDKTDPALAKEVVKIFHVDSWECGSQNWSRNFAAEFKKRRGYDLMPYLLVMTGTPVTNAATSEKVLHDVRTTIAELVNDVFYATLNKLAHDQGCRFSAESIAPTFVSDGLLHYKNVDVPMGEFWLNSPTHDKPNDMLDAISGGHVYGKNIIQAEAFTSVRMNWGEHPGNLKALGDRNFALGINKMVLHVFTHNPWMDKKPGMTLDGVGLYFQRDQTWFKQSKAWIDYLSRCQALLQMGKPVVDIAVFTGEEIPRRSILPDRLINTLPGIFGKEKVEAEKKRLENNGQPLRQIPDGVSHSANMADPEDWIDPLNGYAYDSFNPDALMMMSVKNGKVVLPGGASYSILVLPDKHPMQPNSDLMSVKTAKKLLQLVKEGATVIMNTNYTSGISLKEKDDSIKIIMRELKKKSKVISTPFTDSTFSKLGLQKDMEVIKNTHSIAWNHRKTGETDFYFISNQSDTVRIVGLTFRIAGKEAIALDPVTGQRVDISYNPINKKDGRAHAAMRLQANQTVFILLSGQPPPWKIPSIMGANLPEDIAFAEQWRVEFDPKFGGPPAPVIFDTLKSWSQHSDTMIRYYSGTAVYFNRFYLEYLPEKNNLRLEFDLIYNIATVKINGKMCGTLWTSPYSMAINNSFLKQGINEIIIEVSNTWSNRLIGDQRLPPNKRVTWTTAPFRLKDKPLLSSGLVGQVKLLIR